MTKSPRRILAGLLVATAVLALVYTVAVPKAIEVEETTVARGDLEEVIKSDAVFRSKDRFIVPAFADGDIKRMDLRVGDPVKKGQAITDLFWDAKYEPVRSPIDGVISKVFRESAGPIRRGEPIVEVVDPVKLEVVAELLTTDAARVHQNDRALVEGWGGPEAIHARVSRVSKAGFTKQSALGVEEEKTEVTMSLESIPPDVLSRLGSGFHVEVRIVVSTRQDVLKVPIGAIFRDGPDWAVYRDTAGRATKTRVELGARGERDIEVTRGLSEGQIVVLYPGDLIRDGTRIRPLRKK